MADAMIRMKIPYETEEAIEINAKIFETIYYGAAKRSMELAKIEGAYETFRGSPASEGIL